MLIEPASKVSVPFGVVILTLSNVADNVFVPAVKGIAADGLEKTPDATQIFEETLVITICPENKAACGELNVVTPKPVVYEFDAGAAGLELKEEYPVVSTPPESPS